MLALGGNVQHISSYIHLNVLHTHWTSASCFLNLLLAGHTIWYIVKMSHPCSGMLSGFFYTNVNLALLLSPLPTQRQNNKDPQFCLCTFYTHWQSRITALYSSLVQARKGGLCLFRAWVNWQRTFKTLVSRCTKLIWIYRPKQTNCSSCETNKPVQNPEFLQVRISVFSHSII